MITPMRLKIVAPLLAIAVLALACASFPGFNTPTPEPTATPEATPTPRSTPTPQPTPTPAFVPNPGQWESDGETPVSFEVTEDGLVIGFRIEIADNCIVAPGDPVEIRARDFLVIGEANSAGQPLENSVVGTFVSPTRIEGTYSNPFTCISGNFMTTVTRYGDAPSWSATWVGP